MKITPTKTTRRAASKAAYGILVHDQCSSDWILDYGRVTHHVALRHAIAYAAGALIVGCPIDIDLVELDGTGPVLDSDGKQIAKTHAPKRTVVPWMTLKAAAQRLLDTAERTSK
jgi:hypothetical protein